MAHTPGDWSLIWGRGHTINGARIQDSHGIRICTISHIADRSLTEKKANAHLLLASPDMLNALEHADNFLTNHMRSLGVEPGSPDDLECADLVRNALSKARGETS